MTCITLAFWWYLATLGPNPVLVARFDTADACWQAQATAKRAVTLVER